MSSLEAVRWPLLIVATCAVFFGLLPLGWLARRAGRALRRKDQIPVRPWRYGLALLSVVFFFAFGAATLGLLAALSSWSSFTSKRHVAEVQCIELAPSKLRVYLVPIEEDGVRGETETYDLEGDEWTVGGDVLRFRPFLALLGLETVYRLSRVEGRYNDAAEARAHKPTAFDRAGGPSRPWMQLYRHGTRGPFALLVDGVHGQAVSQLPDRRAVFDLYITPNGLVLNKRSL